MDSDTSTISDVTYVWIDAANGRVGTTRSLHGDGVFGVVAPLDPSHLTTVNLDEFVQTWRHQTAVTMGDPYTRGFLDGMNHVIETIREAAVNGFLVEIPVTPNVTDTIAVTVIR